MSIENKELRSIDARVEEAGGIASLTPESALQVMTDHLLAGVGFYTWETLTPGWLRRTPRTDLSAEVWLREEGERNVHLCNPLLFLSAMFARRLQDTLQASGYAVDGHCDTCGAEEPK